MKSVHSNILAGTAVLVALSAAIAFQPATGAPPPGRGGQPREGQPREGQPGGPGGGREGRGQSVEGGMKAMNRSLKQLNAQIDDPAKKDDNLRLINEIQRGCVAAKGGTLSPRITENAKDDVAKAKLQAAFRKDLIAAMRVLLDVETDIADGKTEAAKNKIAEFIKMGEAGHKEFGVKDEHE